MTDLTVKEASDIITYTNEGMPLAKAIQTIAPRFAAPGVVQPTIDEINRKAAVWDGIFKIPSDTIDDGTEPAPEPAPPVTPVPIPVPVPDGSPAGSTEVGGAFLYFDVGSSAWLDMSSAQQVYIATVVLDQLQMELESSDFERLASHNIG